MAFARHPQADPARFVEPPQGGPPRRNGRRERRRIRRRRLLPPEPKIVEQGRLFARDRPGRHRLPNPVEILGRQSAIAGLLLEHSLNRRTR